MSRILLFLLPIIGCDATLLEVDDPDAVEALERTSCDPTMHVFPVGDAHNIGYDNSSCGTGTCDISCPDANANSDWGGAHHGIDVFAYQGAPLVAVTEADVVAVGTPSSTSGLRVRLRDSCGWEYYYGHMDAASVTVGQHVTPGQQIGTMGYTGTSSTHLHFNVSPDGDYYSDIDPFDLLNSTSATACGAVVTPPEPDPAPTPVGDCGIAWGTTVLGVNQAIDSCDGRFSLVMQGDGNLVLYMNGATALWSTGTHGHPGATAVMQDDGNFVVYDGWTPLWDSGTHGHSTAALVVQDDGNVVIYDWGVALWSTGTHGH